MTRPRRVLYVEDNQQNRRLVQRVMMGAGWEFRAAEDGRQALALLAGDPLPDVVLMDLAMPVLDGYETTTRIRADPRLAWLPVVALTAHAMVGDEERARAAGCDAYLTKPLEVRTFLSVVEEILSHLTPHLARRRLDAILVALEGEARGEPLDADTLERLVRAGEGLVESLRNPCG